MEKLATTLNAYTKNNGSWSIDANEHKSYYQTPLEFFHENDFDKKDYKDLDLNDNIYHLRWFKDSPVGHYDFFANSISDLYYKVKLFVIYDK